MLAVSSVAIFPALENPVRAVETRNKSLPAVALKSVMTSKPLKTESVKVRWSKRSTPSPPVRESFPVPPVSKSLPSPPLSKSLPASPLRVLLLVLPVMTLLAVLPVPLIAAVPVRVTLPMLGRLAIVKVTLD